MPWVAKTPRPLPGGCLISKNLPGFSTRSANVSNWRRRNGLKFRWERTNVKSCLDAGQWPFAAGVACWKISHCFSNQALDDRHDESYPEPSLSEPWRSYVQWARPLQPFDSLQLFASLRPFLPLWCSALVDVVEVGVIWVWTHGLSSWDGCSTLESDIVSMILPVFFFEAMLGNQNCVGSGFANVAEFERWRGMYLGWP